MTSDSPRADHPHDPDPATAADGSARAAARRRERSRDIEVAQWRQFTPQLRAAALCAARAGCFVFPVRPGSKLPALHGARFCRGSGPCADGHQGWEQRATRDEAQIRRWWNMPFNVGIACGPSRLVVIDLDAAHGQAPPLQWAGARDGADVLDRLAVQAGQALTATMTVATPTGGVHHLYRAPDGVVLRNSAAALGWRCDVRAAGGFIVGPGSVRPEGAYRVTHPGPLAELPAWLTARLVELATPPAPPSQPATPLALPDGRAGRYLAAIVEGEADKVRAAASGQRNATMLAAARTLGRLVGGGELGWTEARSVLLAAAAGHIGVDGFTLTEAETTTDRGLEFGARLPRSLRHPSGASGAGPGAGGAR